MQVISNLVDNAVKFTKNGTIYITLNLTNNDRSSPVAVVEVKDDGTGIDTELSHKLFTKFATKSDKGMGLGLYISKGLIEAHGGKIWGENNKDGKGATFTFTLPVTEKGSDLI
jgi:signal transduction histidine kinase